MVVNCFSMKSKFDANFKVFCLFAFVLQVFLRQKHDPVIFGSGHYGSQKY